LFSLPASKKLEELKILKNEIHGPPRYYGNPKIEFTTMEYCIPSFRVLWKLEILVTAGIGGAQSIPGAN
jgi:hypothetical protein